MSEGTHWRTGGKNTNSGCEMLPDGKDIPYIIISSIEYKDHHKVNGRDERGIWVANFAPNPYTKLPMILNSTNRKRISKLFGTDYIDQLKNIAVRLTRERCRDVQDGGETWGLRIHKDKPKAPSAPAKTEPKAKEVLTENHPKWQSAIEQIKEGKFTIEGLKAYFIISEDMEKKIIEAVKGEE